MISNAIIYSRMDTSAYVVYYLRDGQATNAADTAFSTAVLLLMGAAFMYYLNSNRKIKKIIAIAITIFSGYFLIFIAQRGTTFFLSIIMISVLAVSQVSSKTRILFLLLFIFVILWMIMGGAVTLLSVIGKALEGQRIAYKVNYLTNLFRTGNILEAGGSLSDRFMLTMRSYYTFTESFKNFLIGVGDHRNSNEVIGNHSQIIDTFARYGIVGGCLLIASLYEIGVSVIKLSKLSYNTALRLQVISIFFCFTIRGLLGNNMVGSIGTQLFITIPLIVNILTLEGEDSQ